MIWYADNLYNVVRGYRIESPCYPGNGGGIAEDTYYSIIGVDGDSKVVLFVGDHAWGLTDKDGTPHPIYTSLSGIGQGITHFRPDEWEGKWFSDEDRLINIQEADVNIGILEDWHNRYKAAKAAREVWDARRLAFLAQFTGRGYTRKQAEALPGWYAENPIPPSVAYYGFLACVK